MCEAGTEDVLRYVRDMIFAMVRRKLRWHNDSCLIERRNCSTLKEKLAKDIHDIFSLGEGGISSLPKSLFKPENQSHRDQSCQTNPIYGYASTEDLENVKNDLLCKIADIREEMKMAASVTYEERTSNTSSVDRGTVTNQNGGSLSNPGKSSQQCSDSDQPHRKYILASDSLLHRTQQAKMKVNDIPCVKLSKRGDDLQGTFHRITQYVTKNSKSNFDVVVLTGTDDLRKNQVTPEILCDKTIEEINNLRSFSNIGHIVLCKVPPRSDLHRVNLKVSSYNNLVSQKLKELVNVSIIDTVPLELKLFYKDGRSQTLMWYYSVQAIFDSRS